MRSPLLVEYFSDLDRNEDSSDFFPRVWCLAFSMGSPISGCVAFFCALDWKDGFFRPSILCCFAMGSPYGSKRSLLWITGRYSFRMGSDSTNLISIEGITTVGLLGAFSGPSLG